MTRTPVAVASVVDDYGVQNTTVIADDGTMWFLAKDQWERIPDLPQPDEKAGATDG